MIIKIGSDEFFVRRVAEGELRDDDTGHDLEGQFDDSQEVISIEDGHGPSYTFKIAWHESWHAVLCEEGHDKDSHDEKEVERMARRIIGILEANPHMRSKRAFYRKFLQQEVED